MNDIDLVRKNILEKTLKTYSIEKFSNSNQEIILKICLTPNDGYGRKKEFNLLKSKFKDACIAISINFVDKLETRHILGIISDNHFIESNNNHEDAVEMIDTMLFPEPNDELYYIPLTYLFL